MAARVSLSKFAEMRGIDRKTLARARKRTPPLPCYPGKRGQPVEVDPDEAGAWLEANGLGKPGRQPKTTELLREAQKAPAGPVAASASAPPGQASTPSQPEPLTAEEHAALGEAFGGIDAVKAALGLRPEAVKKLSAIAAARKEFADAQKREHEVAKARGQLVDTAEVHRGRMKRVAIVKQGMLAVPQKLAARLVGRTEDEIRDELQGEMSSLLRLFSEEFSKL